jgi:hypothetical protein
MDRKIKNVAIHEIMDVYDDDCRVKVAMGVGENISGDFLRQCQARLI